jgi:predicted RNA-binding protein YlxR (DUF448 family)
MKKSQPIRMCIMCRKRDKQSNLIRLKYQDNLVVPYDGMGRSFYLCADCANNQKKLKGISKRYKQSDQYIISLIENLKNRLMTV